jgi:hypothetical protein
MSGPYFDKVKIRKFLAEQGYTSNPEGLIELYPADYVSETEGEGYIDINADAIRKGNEVPDRPVRIRFQKISYGHSSHWELESVAELPAGVQTKACNRSEGLPKISPWPETKKSE